MPKRTRSQYGGRRSIRKKRKVSARSGGAPRSELTTYGGGPTKGLPQGMYAIMKYSWSIGLASSTTLAYNVFRANGLFDPDLTATGHQPYGHDQWAQLYRQYQVNWAEIEVIFQNTVAADNGAVPSTVGIYASTDSNAPPALTTLSEAPVNTIGNCGCLENDPVKLKLKVRISDIVGDRKNIWDKQYTALFGADPIAQAFFTVVAQSDVGNDVSVQARVTITYYCWLWDPVLLSQS